MTGRYKVECRFHNLLRQNVYTIIDSENGEIIGIIFDNRSDAFYVASEAASLLNLRSRQSEESKETAMGG